MPSPSTTRSTMSSSGGKSGKSTSSYGSYASLDKPVAGQAPKSTHKTSGTGYGHALSVSATGGGHSGPGATMYGSTGDVGVTVDSVSSSSSSGYSGKDSVHSNDGGLPTDASKEEKKRNDKTTKAKKRSAKKHDVSYENVYTMGGDKDGFGRAQVGSGSGAPTGCLLM